MPVWNVTGGNTLEGCLRVQGAKNAVLPILAASLLGGVSRIRNCPNLSDVDASVEILRHLGCGVMQIGGEILVDSRQMDGISIPQTLMRKMRSSVIFMGSILARCGEVRLSEPGGCALGQRPVDLHLKALRALGAEITESEGEILCRAASLRGCPIRLEYPSVGATENVMLAACGAKGETRLTNAAREPEIVDLQDFLNAKGARISGAGSSDICIRGFDCRPKTEHTVMPDRIAAATFLCGAAAAGGDICLRDTVPTHVYTVTDALEAMGCVVTAGRDEIRLRSDGRLRACPPIVTMPYPGFPTDAQPLLMAAALRAEGTSYFTETVFDDRFRCTAQMRRFGGEIRLRGRTAEVRGVQTLHGGGVRAEDLRGGAALIIAALAAEGRSEITDAGYIARGYEDLAGALGSLGGAVSLRGVE